jgi:predicted branched-subunit amino acid permease
VLAFLQSLRRHAVRRQAFNDGMRAVLPSLVGMLAWGIVTGVAMVKVGLELVPALVMTFLVYSGTSQLAVLPLLATGTAVATLAATAFVANLRFVVYSATLAPHLRRLPIGPRLLIGFVTIDGPLAALLARRLKGPLVQRVAFLCGANTITYAAWTGASVIGIALAAVLPMGPEAVFIAVLALLVMAAPLLTGRPAWAAALASGVVAVACAGWPHGLGTVAAVLAGVVAALLAVREPPAAEEPAR